MFVPIFGSQAAVTVGKVQACFTESTLPLIIVKDLTVNIIGACKGYVWGANIIS